ncbi:unnamed protein product [Sphacelaria rigidula]
MKKSPSWARMSSCDSYENLQNLAEGLPLSFSLPSGGVTSSPSVAGMPAIMGMTSSAVLGSGGGSLMTSSMPTTSSMTRSTSFGTLAPSSSFMPRNTSVEDFLSLVESGDIPPPEGAAGFTVPMWINGGSESSTNASTGTGPSSGLTAWPACSNNASEKGSSTSTNKTKSKKGRGSGSDQSLPKSKRLKASAAKAEAKG